MKRIITIIFVFTILMTGIFVISPVVPRAAVSNFEFDGSMSKEVLRNYISRAVTFQGFAVENNKEDPIFEEDLRMIQRIGAKYIGRAAFYSWGGDLSLAQIENHFSIAKKQAEKAHAQDPELILQAGVFEIAYQGTVNNTPIPEYVFKAFGKSVENRNFNYEKIVFPKGTTDANGTDTGIGCWGNPSAGVPDITQLETKMYFYYLITRYIDAGYEAFHMGQAEKMMLYRGNYYATHWDELLTKARAYAKTHARRGIALFDCHSEINSGGIKVGNRLIFDIQGAAAVPNETEQKNGAMMCKIASKSECWLSWIGYTDGGTHPLGFNIESNFTIIEFDNYGGNGNPGVATYDAFYNWGMDDITWFATQPEWYRNQFLLESADYLQKNCLDSKGNQQYFLQPCCRRVITPEIKYIPKIEYTPSDKYNVDFFLDYIEKERSTVQYDSAHGKYILSVKGDYRANRNSDACPNGFSQEDTIRDIFLGNSAPENSDSLDVVIPPSYNTDGSYNKEFTVRSRKSDITESTDKVLSDLAIVTQGKMVDIWAEYRSAGEPADISHLEIKDGQYIVLALDVDETTTALRLEDLDFDSAQSFKIEISYDNKSYSTLVDYFGNIENSSLEANIKTQFFDNENLCAYVLSRADISDGKKRVYLKFSTYQNNGQMRIRGFGVATRKESFSSKAVAKQQIIAYSHCRSDYDPYTLSPHYFENHIVSNMSNYQGLYWLIKLDSTYNNAVFKFDLEDTATTFNPYLYVAGDKTAKVKIEASNNGRNWLEIIPSTTVSPHKYYGDLGTTNWTNINQSNIDKVLEDNATKTVYLRYSYSGRGNDSEIQLQHFGLSADFNIELAELGDSNVDGILNILDLISIKNAILDNSKYVVYHDLNKDNAISSLDLIMFKKYLFSIF